MVNKQKRQARLNHIMLTTLNPYGVVLRHRQISLSKLKHYTRLDTQVL
jgi:hypothetical protein